MLNMYGVEHKVEGIFRTVMKMDEGVELSDNMNPDDVEEWNSLESMMLVTQINKEFSIRLEFADILEMTSLGEIKRIVKKYVDR